MRSFGVVITVYLLAFKQLSGQCVKGDCYNGEGTYKAKNGSIYQGVSEWGTSMAGARFGMPVMIILLEYSEVGKGRKW